MSHIHIETKRADAPKSAQLEAAEKAYSDWSNSQVGEFDGKGYARVSAELARWEAEHDMHYGHAHIYNPSLIPGLECPEEGLSEDISKADLVIAVTAGLSTLETWGSLVNGLGMTVANGWVNGNRVITPSEVAGLINLLRFDGPFVIYYD